MVLARAKAAVLYTLAGNEGTAVKTSTYMRPRLISAQRPAFFLVGICNLQRKYTGSAVRTRSLSSETPLYNISSSS